MRENKDHARSGLQTKRASKYRRVWEKWPSLDAKYINGPMNSPFQLAKALWAREHMSANENSTQIEQIRENENILHSTWNFPHVLASELSHQHGLDQNVLVLPPHFMSCWEPIEIPITNCVTWLDIWKKIDDEIGFKVEDYEQFSPLSCYIEDFTVGATLSASDHDFKPNPSKLYALLERGG